MPVKFRPCATTLRSEQMSKSLLVNVLDMEDNYKLGLGQPSFTASHTVPDIADVYRRRLLHSK